MADINVGVLAEQINSKADIDLRNIDTTKCDMVIEYQEPTEENNYTWYRLYATGWIEQGGYIAADATTYDDYAITLPVLMADTHYFKQKLFHKGRGDSSGFSWAWLADHRASGPDDTTSIAYFCIPSNSYALGLYWKVSGKVDPSVMLNHEILPSKAKNEEFEHRVIEFQKPTADNNYTWFRKYADGWVEQGGVSVYTSDADYTVSMPIEMNDVNYTILTMITPLDSPNTSADVGAHRFLPFNLTTTSFKLHGDNTAQLQRHSWQVSGMAA